MEAVAVHRRHNVSIMAFPVELRYMSFEKGDAVILRDDYHDKDGEEGEVVEVSETMFGDESYTIEVDGERVAGLGEGQLDEA